ncbi:hypothetical protein PENANT_c001G10359 [Penicillium antarcticum]|uniref:Uncharacterized protein n=1 Tax=Penicillium antarcticum TaxID=416450 RepID=A0A1V6QNI6_9EURO|nr:hypothetical protein PENANT_c001G10359 [Penicillium antarcticum]
MCDIAVQDVFGPTVDSSCRNGFDYTLLFEESFFNILPYCTCVIDLRKDYAIGTGASSPAADP